MELSLESSCQCVTWKVQDFFELPSEIGYSLDSPEFRFAGDSYCLRMYPNWSDDDKGGTAIELVRLTSTFPERSVSYKLGYRSKYKEREDDNYCIVVADTLLLIARSILQENRDMNVPNGTLTALCCMRLKVPYSAAIPQSEAAKTSDTKEEQEVLPETPDSVSCAVQTETPDSVSCAVQAEVSDSVVDKEIFKNEDVSSLGTKDVTLLSERMEYLLKKGSDYDLTICVQDKEFRAHRSILSARSPVFAMMLSHDTKENSTGTISIEDCDPDSFDEFLLYVYSGRTENLTPSRALQIYYTADKYDFSSLKERSVRILKTSLSITSICDVVLLAAKHQEEELLEVATEFFARNIKKIIVTVGWQKFMSQNPVEANELYVKSMEILLPEN